MFNLFSSFKISRVFLLSILFLTFIIFIVITIFSTFIFNNSRVQLVESLYLQAQSINKLIPKYDEAINFDEYADNGNLIGISSDVSAITPESSNEAARAREVSPLPAVARMKPRVFKKTMGVSVCGAPLL